MCNTYVRFITDQDGGFSASPFHGFKNIALEGETKNHFVVNFAFGRQEFGNLITDISRMSDILCSDDQWNIQPVCYFDYPAHPLQEWVVIFLVFFLYKRRLNVDHNEHGVFGLKQL